jgi:peptidoglycan/LPS O-acetylase OafA/YrhL
MYMLFPFLVSPFMRLSSIAKISVFLSCFVGYVFIMLVLQKYVTVPPALSFIKPEPNINVAYQYGFLRCLFGFVIGMMAYLAYKKGFAQRFLANGTALILSTLCLGICLHFGVPDVLTVFFYPLIILSAAYGSKNIDGLFGNKVMQRLGDWSFSIYLVHQPIVYTIFTLQAFFNPSGPGPSSGPPPAPGLMTAWIICLVFIAFTLLLSWLTYKYVEVPSRNWINNRFKTRDVKSNLPTI